MELLDELELEELVLLELLVELDELEELLVEDELLEELELELLVELLLDELTLELLLDELVELLLLDEVEELELVELELDELVAASHSARLVYGPLFCDTKNVHKLCAGSHPQKNPLPSTDNEGSANPPAVTR